MQYLVVLLVEPNMVPPGTIIWNSDAAWSRDTLSAGLGWVSSSELAPSLTGSKVCANVSSPLLTETLALRETVAEAQVLSADNVWIRSDSEKFISRAGSTST
ncbi:RNase H domain-containing protein [Raphanus sativus]|nr:RNase H domain-containing protein [Raphanus sativus]KAJ4899873.1 RNase H domain-containing protein [Raphanus sativus]